MQNTIATSYNKNRLDGLSKADLIFLVTLCTGLFLAFLIGEAHAGIGVAICNIAAMAQNDAAKGIATIAVICLGIGAMLGKVSWSMALIVAVGITVTYSAASLAKSVHSSAGCPGLG